MGIIYKLTLRHMLLNKKRTIVTMVGIILSVTMLAAVPTAVYSLMDFFARGALENTGYYHVIFNKYRYGDNEKILDELDVENYVIAKIIGDYEYESEEDVTKAVPYEYNEKYDYPDLCLVEVTDEYYEMVKATLAEGTYPASDSEILVQKYTPRGEYKLGDKLTIGGKEYTVSGLINSLGAELFGYGVSFLDTVYTKMDSDRLNEDDIVNGYFYLNNPGTDLQNLIGKLNEELDKGRESKNKQADEIAVMDDEMNVILNYDALQYYGISYSENENNLINIIIGSILFVIVVAAGAAIGNGFSISLSERSRYLGMIASVGATKKQKRGSVYFEGIIEGIIAIPIGLVLGMCGMTVVLEIIEPIIKRIIGIDTELYMVMDIRTIVWAVAFSIIIICVSVYLPARRASRISPIDAIRQNKDVKLMRRNVKTMKLTRKIFGFEGDLALKNIKRNNKRYVIIVSSMAISFILFITVYGMMYYFRVIRVNEKQYINVDMVLEMYADDEEEGQAFEAMEEKIIATGLLEEYHRYAEFGSYDENMFIRANTMITEDKYYTEDYLTYLKDTYKANEIQAIYPIIMTEEDLRAYLKSVDIDYDEFVSDKYNVILFDDYQDRYEVEGAGVYSYKGDVYSEELKSFDYQMEIMERIEYEGEDGEKYWDFRVNDTKTMSMNVFSREKNLLGLGVDYDCWNGCVYMLLTPELTEEMYQLGMYRGHRIFALNTSAHDKMAGMIEEETEKLEDCICENNIEVVDRAEDVILLISIFTYGFITLMSLIIITSIVNTISTSFALRKREFAMLKSVGMTDKAFRRMIIYESCFYGMKALFFGIPIGSVFVVGIKYMIEQTVMNNPGFPWAGYIMGIAGVFAVIGITMLYSARKIRKENVIDALRNENV